MGILGGIALLLSVITISNCVQPQNSAFRYGDRGSPPTIEYVENLDEIDESPPTYVDILKSDEEELPTYDQAVKTKNILVRSLTV